MSKVRIGVRIENGFERAVQHLIRNNHPATRYWWIQAITWTTPPYLTKEGRKEYRSKMIGMRGAAIERLAKRIEEER